MRIADLESQRLLLVEDDEALRGQLARAMSTRGFEVRACASEIEALAVAGDFCPAFALVDFRLRDGDGLSIIAALRQLCPDCRSVILSGYGNIPSAVAATKAGAVVFLPKPSDPDDIANALRQAPGERARLGEHSINPDQARLAHILSIFEEQNHRLAATARRLGMHRRTLQRILKKISATNGAL
jgi:two-component system response regulator RegA